MSDIYDDILTTIYKLYKDDWNFYLRYGSNHKKVFGEVVRAMNPVPYDLKDTLNQFYADLTEEFKKPSDDYPPTPQAV